MVKKIKTVFVYGNFNIIHPGHLRLLHFARELAENLIVGVFSDKISGKSVYVEQSLRLKNVESITCINKSFIIENPINEIIAKLKPDIVVKGKEFENIINPEAEVIKSYGGRLVFSSGESSFSSFDLIQKEFSSPKDKLIPRDFLNRHKISLKKLIDIINNFNKKKIMVIGDLIIDEYITCDALGMSQEDPTIVVTPVSNTLFIGGAGIVAAHAAGLGAKVKFITIAGNDEMKIYAEKYLKEIGVKPFINIDKNRPTTLKKRYRCKGKTLLRVSHLHQGMIDQELQDIIYNQFKSNIQNIDVIVFSDFNYGCLPTLLVEKIIKYGLLKNKIMIADSQSSSQIGDIARFKEMNLITPTEREARLSVQDYDCGLVVLAEKLRSISKANNILLKLGENGILIHSHTKNDQIETDKLQALNSSPKDVAGAGDSMLISSALALSCGANLWEASLIGTIAASVQVSRVGNKPLNIKELITNIY